MRSVPRRRLRKLETWLWTRPRRRPRMLETSPRTLETWLWTGPVGHLLGGAADFFTALARYLVRYRVRSRRRPAASHAGPPPSRHRDAPRRESP